MPLGAIETHRLFIPTTLITFQRHKKLHHIYIHKEQRLPLFWEGLLLREFPIVGWAGLLGISSSCNLWFGWLQPAPAQTTQQPAGEYYRGMLRENTSCDQSIKAIHTNGAINPLWCCLIRYEWLCRAGKESGALALGCRADRCREKRHRRSGFSAGVC